MLEVPFEYKDELHLISTNWIHKSNRFSFYKTDDMITDILYFYDRRILKIESPKRGELNKRHFVENDLFTWVVSFNLQSSELLVGPTFAMYILRMYTDKSNDDLVRRRVGKVASVFQKLVFTPDREPCQTLHT